MDALIICIFGLIVNEQDVSYVTKNAKTGYPDTDNLSLFFLSSLRTNDCMRVRPSVALWDHITARGYELVL